MKVKELESRMNESQMFLVSAKHKQECLQELKEVQDYLAQVALIAKEKAYLQFLNQLEIGSDGTVFSCYEPWKDKVHKNTHFGLSRVLRYAFHLIGEKQQYPLDFLEISFEQFLDYTENAKQILMDMNYVSGDRLVKNCYDVEVYENPKNYSVVDFEQLIPSFTDEVLQQDYPIKGVIVSNNYFIMRKYCCDQKDSLTPREMEAFFGEKAKKILGILPKKERKRNK